MTSHPKTSCPAFPGLIPVRALAFVMYYSKDIHRTCTFYQQMFGFRPGEEWEDFWSEFATAPVTLFLNGPDPSHGFVCDWHGAACVALAVDDVPAASTLCRQHGVTVLIAPVETKVCWMAWIADPDGNRPRIHPASLSRRCSTNVKGSQSASTAKPDPHNPQASSPGFHPPIQAAAKSRAKPAGSGRCRFGEVVAFLPAGPDAGASDPAGGLFKPPGRNRKQSRELELRTPEGTGRKDGLSMRLTFLERTFLYLSMPRPKEFDETEVLDHALELFRARGFKHTSFSDLTGELGVSRQSLYDTYGDKQTLYQTALKRYMDRGADGIHRKLADPAPVRKVFAALFEGMIEGNCANGSPGCLMVNTMVELSPHDAETRALVAEYAGRIEGLLADRLRAAQAAGELARSKDPVALACFFYHTILGLAVSSRALGNKACLRQTARVALQTLD